MSAYDESPRARKQSKNFAASAVKNMVQCNIFFLATPTTGLSAISFETKVQKRTINLFSADIARRQTGTGIVTYL